MKNAAWFFDFIFPFAYLQNYRLRKFYNHLILDKNPLLFGVLLILSGVSFATFSISMPPSDEIMKTSILLLLSRVIAA